MNMNLPRPSDLNLARPIVEMLLSALDVKVGGERPWDLQVNDDRAFRRMLLEGSLGVGESYMDGWWDVGDLEELIKKLIAGGVERKARLLPNFVGMNLRSRFGNRQTRRLSEEVVRHYNLDNDLFCGFLGKHKNYSCALFDGTDDLDEAQRLKMERICRKGEIQAGDRVLDVGGGWGELARYIATSRGCRVTSINISEEQLRYARTLCAGADVDVVKCDYRDFTGTFDKMVVIAVISQMGDKNLRSFFARAHRHLVSGGVLFVDTVGSNESVVHGNPWIDKYFFPGIVFPSIAQIGRAVEGLFVVEDVLNIGPSYARTLRAWNTNLQRAWPGLAAKHDERVRRMFEFFFKSVAAFFAMRDMQNWHIVLRRL